MPWRLRLLLPTPVPLVLQCPHSQAMQPRRQRLWQLMAARLSLSSMEWRGRKVGVRQGWALCCMAGTVQHLQAAKVSHLGSCIAPECCRLSQQPPASAADTPLPRGVTAACIQEELRCLLPTTSVFIKLHY